VAADGGEQDLALRREDLLPGVGVEARDWAEQPPQPAGVVVHPNRADRRQGHRARMAVTHPDT